MRILARVGWIGAAALCVATATGAGQTAPERAVSTNVAIRVNCGGSRHVDRLGQVFEADAPFTEARGWGYVGGHAAAARSGVEIARADEPALFLTDRWGVDAYRFAMRPGVYRVTLFFSEYHFSEVGMRVFDVLLNGRPVAKGLDLVERAGQNGALAISAMVLAEDGAITITTHDVVDRNKFSAIAIEPALPDEVAPPPPSKPVIYERDREVGVEWVAAPAEDLWGFNLYRSTVHDGPYEKMNGTPIPTAFHVDGRLHNDRSYFYRVAAVDYFGNESARSEPVEARPRAHAPQDLAFGINVGGDAVRDNRGRTFFADREYNPANGCGYALPARVRTGTTREVVEPAASVREGTIAYRLDLPPGIYRITLGFYDAWARGAMDRVFSVWFNGFRALTDLDLAAQYGASLPVEIARTFRVDDNGLAIALEQRHGAPLLAFVYVEPATADAVRPAAPSFTRQVARDGVAYIEWTPAAADDVVGYMLLRATGDSPAFSIATRSLIGVNSYVDKTVTNGVRYRYEVVAVDASGNESPASAEIVAAPHNPDDDELLDIIQRASFEYFVRECDPKTFLTKDKSVSAEISTAASGFGLSAYVVGAERGWMPREEAENRAYLMLRALNAGDDNKVYGMFYHYLRGDGSRSQHGYEDVVSTVDTALLMWGALCAGEYFGGRVKSEAELMMERMNWRAFANEGRRMIAMAYRPATHKFDGLWDYFTDEALLVTILAVIAPNEAFRVDPIYYYSFKRERRTYKGIPDIICSWSGSFFTYAFAHCWLDFRALGPDDPARFDFAPELRADWWENSVKAARANRAFCIAMAKKYSTFGEQAWGLSASSGPDAKYVVAGAPPCGDSANPGEGTLALYGAGMAVPFLPDEAIAALRNYYTMRGADGQKLLWRDEFDGGYGLIDSFNLDKQFFSKEAQGINHGPMLLLIENYRSGLLWKQMLKNATLREGLAKLGFAVPDEAPRAK